LGNEDNEFSIEDTSTEGVVVNEEIVLSVEEIEISLRIAGHVILDSGLELLAVNINTEDVVQSDLIVGGIFTVPDRL